MNNENIVVEYVCECGNTQLLSDPTTNRQYKSCVQAWACRTICLACGKDMELRVSKETHKIEVKVIGENP